MPVFHAALAFSTLCEHTTCRNAPPQPGDAASLTAESTVREPHSRSPVRTPKSGDDMKPVPHRVHAVTAWHVTCESSLPIAGTCEWLSSTAMVLGKHSVESDDAVRQRGGQCASSSEASVTKSASLWRTTSVGKGDRTFDAVLCPMTRSVRSWLCVQKLLERKFLAFLCHFLTQPSHGLPQRGGAARDGVPAVLPPSPEFDWHGRCGHMCVRAAQGLSG